jgi:hypothetical protein
VQRHDQVRAEQGARCGEPRRRRGSHRHERDADLESGPQQARVALHEKVRQRGQVTRRRISLGDILGQRPRGDRERDTPCHGRAHILEETGCTPAGSLGQQAEAEGCRSCLPECKLPRRDERVGGRERDLSQVTGPHEGVQVDERPSGRGRLACEHGATVERVEHGHDRRREGPRRSSRERQEQRFGERIGLPAGHGRQTLEFADKLREAHRGH